MAKPSSKPTRAGYAVAIDNLIAIQATFLNWTESAVQKGRKKLAELEEYIAGELARRFADGMPPKTRRQVEQGIESIQAAQTEAILGFGRQMASEATRKTSLTAEEIFTTFRDTPGAPTFAARQMLSATQIRELAKDDILGDTAGKWFKVSAMNANVKAERILKASYAEGSSFETIHARMRDFGKVRDHEQEALARTVIQGISNNASRELYSRNQDAMDGLQWVATLDDVTCPQCGPLDGAVYYYRPKAGQRSVDQMPTAPLHPNCRCTTVPYDEELSPPVSTWEEWLGRQGPETQDAALGPGRASLYREGVITASDLRGRSGAIRPVSELRAMAEKRRAAA